MPQDGQQIPVSDAAIKAAAETLKIMREGPGWKILMIRLEAEAANAYEELVYVDAADVNKIESLQREIKRYKWFGETIDGLIKDGLGKEESEEDFPDA